MIKVGENETKGDKMRKTTEHEMEMNRDAKPVNQSINPVAFDN
jgi:hypothetical protein